MYRTRKDLLAVWPPGQPDVLLLVLCNVESVLDTPHQTGLATKHHGYGYTFGIRSESSGDPG